MNRMNAEPLAAMSRQKRIYAPRAVITNGNMVSEQDTAVNVVKGFLEMGAREHKFDWLRPFSVLLPMAQPVSADRLRSINVGIALTGTL